MPDTDYSIRLIFTRRQGNGKLRYLQKRKDTNLLLNCHNACLFITIKYLKRMLFW